jgi:hypothetical protein
MIYGLNGFRLKIQRLQPLHVARNIRPIELKKLEVIGLVGFKPGGWKAWKFKSATFA